MKTKTKTRVLSLLLTLAMLLTSFVVVIPASAAAWDGTTKTEPKVVEGVYQLGTVEELAYFFDKIATGDTTYSAAKAKLTANIDCQSKDWTFIGGTYTGTFDGNGKTISNLKLVATQTASDQAFGLFAKAKDATIKNLNVKFVAGNIARMVDANDIHVGGVVGYASGTLAMSNVHVSGTIKASASARINFGGIVGSVNVTSAIFSNCTTDNIIADLTLGNKLVSGKALGDYVYDGSSNDKDSANINFPNRVYTDTTEGPTSRVGGILGTWHATGGTLTMIDCHDIHNFKIHDGGSNIRMGGLVGILQKAPTTVNLIDCSGAGSYTDSGSKKVAGTTTASIGGVDDHAHYIGHGAATNLVLLHNGEFSGANVSGADVAAKRVNSIMFKGSSPVPTSIKESILAISQTVVGDTVTVKLGNTLVALLDEAFSGWKINYNGTEMTKGTDDADGNAVYTATAVAGKNASITLASGVVYNISSSDTLGTWAGVEPVAYAGGDGSAENPFQISTPEQLIYYANEVAKGTTDAPYSEHVVLTNDIDLKGYAWPYNSGNFGGIFDGAGYEIKNLKFVPIYGKTAGAGFIAWATRDGAVIKNFSLTVHEGSYNTIYSGEAVVGLLVGQAYGKLTVSDVSVKGTFNQGMNTSSNFGGIVGVLYGDAIFNNVEVDLVLKASFGSSTTRVGAISGMCNGAAGTQTISFVNVKTNIAVDVIGGGVNTRIGGLFGTLQAAPKSVMMVDVDSHASQSGNFVKESTAGVSDYFGCPNAAAPLYFLTKTPGLIPYWVHGTGEAQTLTTGYFGMTEEVDGENVTLTVGNATDSYLKKNFTSYTVNYGTQSKAVANAAAATDAGVAFTFTKEENANVSVSFNHGTNALTYDVDMDAPMDWFAFPSLGLDGDGSAESPYMIENANDLAFLANQVAADNTYKDKTVQVAKNAVIDLAGKNWSPIGGYNKTFQGTFDGNGATFDNLSFLLDGYYQTGYGFFRAVNTATLKNFTVNWATVENPGTFLLTTKEYWSTTDKKWVAANQNNTNLGGLAAYSNANTTIQNVVVGGEFYVNATINIHVGNIVCNVGSSTTSITDCSTSLNVTINQLQSSSTVIRYGGAAAIVNGDLNVTNFANSGNFALGGKPAHPRAGGIIGDSQSGTLTLSNCFYAGKLSYLPGTTKPAIYAGNIIGNSRNATAPSMTNCSSLGGMATEDVGGYDTADRPEVTGTANTYATGLGIADGARVRIAADCLTKGSGLRFDGKVDLEVLEQLKAAYGAANVEVGITITTIENYNAVKGDWNALVEGVKTGKIEVTATTFNQVAAEKVGTVDDYQFAGSIVNLFESNYNREFVATSYLTITIADGVTVTVYADADVARTMADVADAAIADHNNPETATKYSAEALELLALYAAANG